MADYLHGKFNPQSGYEKDVCVCILGTVPVFAEPTCTYHDVLDCGLPRLKRVRRRTRGPLIASSLEQEEALHEMFSRPIYCIPQHHCNFDNETRPERPVRTVGCIGGDSAIQWPHYAMERLMREIGMEWRFCYEYNRRHKVVQFYRGLDVQVSWRPTHPRHIMRHMNVLKLSNAGSFGIPTISYPEPAYTREWKNECFWADSIYDMVAMVKRLKDTPSLYAEMSGRVLRKAKSYHIDAIARLYKDLPVQCA